MGTGACCLDATFQDKRFLLRSQFTSESSAALRLPESPRRPRCANCPSRSRRRKCIVKAFWHFYKSFFFEITYNFEVLKTGLDPRCRRDYGLPNRKLPPEATGNGRFLWLRSGRS